IDITAPQDGTVLHIAVTPGQYVPAGAALLSLADLSELWVRVPVPEADLPRVALGQPAAVALKPPHSGAAKDLLPPLQLPFLALVPGGRRRPPQGRPALRAAGGAPPVRPAGQGPARDRGGAAGRAPPRDADALLGRGLRRPRRRLGLPGPDAQGGRGA